MKNHYEVCGDMTILYLSIKGGGFHKTLIDTSDLERVMEFVNTWYACFVKDTNSHYVRGQLTTNKKPSKIYLHRWLMNPPKNLKVDHINHDTLDNRRSNLRVCTNAENMRNATIRSNNTSGVTGVSWVIPISKWVARIRVNKIDIQIGCFKDFEDAVTARKRAEEQYFGEYRFMGIG